MKYLIFIALFASACLSTYFAYERGWRDGSDQTASRIDSCRDEGDVPFTAENYDKCMDSIQW